MVKFDLPFDLSKIPFDQTQKIFALGVRYVGYYNGKHQYTAPDAQTILTFNKIVGTDDEGQMWNLLLEEGNFDPCIVANVVKNNGMPENEKFRTLLLNRFRNLGMDDFGFLFFGYEFFCNYAETFKTYAEDLKKTIDRKINEIRHNDEEKNSLYYMYYNKTDLAPMYEKFYNDGILTLEEFEFLLYQSPYVNGSELIARRKNYDQYAAEVFGTDNICT